MFSQTQDSEERKHKSDLLVKREIDNNQSTKTYFSNILSNSISHISLLILQTNHKSLSQHSAKTITRFLKGLKQFMINLEHTANTLSATRMNSYNKVKNPKKKKKQTSFRKRETR